MSQSNNYNNQSYFINFTDGYDIQVGTKITAIVNDLNERRVDEFLMAFGRSCFKVSMKVYFT